MLTRFFASQSVLIPVVDQRIPIQHYLRQPQRLVAALVDPSRIEPLGDDRFRLKMRPLTLMMLTFQPTVDMRVWVNSDGTVNLESRGCKIRGIDYIDQRFHLKLVGQLRVKNIQEQTYLDGVAHLEVNVELPPPLWLTPELFLETAGNGLLKSVLLTIKQRLMHQLLADYQAWAAIGAISLEPIALEPVEGNLCLQGNQGY